MSSLNDSDAVFDISRQYPQHQALITIIQGMLPNPKLSKFNWLDLACGKGQIILHLEKNIDEAYRSKIIYRGYDIQENYLKLAEKKASELGLCDYHFITGEIDNFPAIFNESLKFECITLINVIHEVSPKLLATLLFESFLRLSDEGFLFIYDMEQLNPPELGAVTWTSNELKEILNTFFGSMEETYASAGGAWQHSTCRAWNAFIKRIYYNIDNVGLSERRDFVINETNRVIDDLISRKYTLCKNALDSFTIHEFSSKEEEQDLVNNLYQFWALSRAKGGLE